MEQKWSVDDPIEAAELDGVAFVAQQASYLGAAPQDCMNDPESCADIIQECSAAYIAKGGKGKGKGKGNYPVRPSNLSIEDRRKMLAKLKAKTPCKDCGRKGHWRGESWATENGGRCSSQ